MTFEEWQEEHKADLMLGRISDRQIFYAGQLAMRERAAITVNRANVKDFRGCTDPALDMAEQDIRALEVE